MRSTESRAARICHPQRQAGCLATFVRNKSTNIFVYVVVVKIIALIVKHSLRYLWMQEAGGLATHDILSNYLVTNVLHTVRVAGSPGSVDRPENTTFTIHMSELFHHTQLLQLSEVVKGR
jgi:hypothetical protein